MAYALSTGALSYAVCLGGGPVGAACCGGGRGAAVPGGIAGVGDDPEKYPPCISIGGIFGSIGAGCWGARCETCGTCGGAIAAGVKVVGGGGGAGAPYAEVIDGTPYAAWDP